MEFICVCLYKKTYLLKSNLIIRIYFIYDLLKMNRSEKLTKRLYNINQGL